MLSGPLINIDETTVQVLREAGRNPSTKSYMWVMRGGPPSYIGLLYFYSETRSSEVARELLNGYRGIVQSDGYQGYGYLDEKEEVEHARC